MTARERLRTAMLEAFGPDEEAILSADPHLAADIEAGQRLREATERMDAGLGVDLADIPRDDPMDEQDRRDGAALRRLREALPEGHELMVRTYRGEVRVGVRHEGFERMWRGTIAEAADACREALEAGR